MPWQLSAVVVLFVSLAVILHYGSQIRTKVFPETEDYQPTTAATAEATAKPFLQLTHQVPSQTLAARSMDGHITSQRAAPTSSSEPPTTHTTVKTLATMSLITANSTPTTSPTTHTLVTTLATPNSSHTAAPITEATIGPSAAPGSPPTTIPPVAHTTGTSPSTVSHTSRKTTQPRNQTALPATLSTPPYHSTTSHKSAQPSHAPGPTTAAHNTTQTASPATTTSGPTLAPRPSSAKTGMYQVLNGSRICIKAEMGIELAVQDTESVFSPQRYFNIDPNATQASGSCGSRKSNLLLNFQGGFVNFTFTKGLLAKLPKSRSAAPKKQPLGFPLLFTEEKFLDIVTAMLSKKGLIDVEDKIHILNIGDYETPTVHFAEVRERTLGLKDENSYYISEVRAYLTVTNPEKIYQGMKSSVVMFETVVGHSFKCVSEQSIQLSTHLQLKTMNVQYQAFDFEDDHFGNADECFTDRNRRENPVAVGLSIAVLLVVLLTACLVANKRPSRGYERM